MRAFVRAGGAVKLQVGVALPQIKAGHVIVRNEYCGINFIDTYYRDGLYPLPDGSVVGAEAGGVVQDAPDELKSTWLNKRVVFFNMGGFAEYTSVPVSRLISVPEDVSMPVALALTTMGLTAHYLCFSTFEVKRGDNVLVHAVGSGTGNLVAQVAQNVCGAVVVGTCSTTKMKTAPIDQRNVVDYTGFSGDLALKLKSLTPGSRGFDVVYDGVGKSTYSISLDAVKPRGLVVYFGNASGPVPAIDPLLLSSKGSLFITRPRLHDYVAIPEELRQRSTDVFDWVRRGLIKVPFDKEFAGLESIDEALDFIKSGKASGKVVVRLDAKGNI